jgi:hypothetical protein
MTDRENSEDLLWTYALGGSTVLVVDSHDAPSSANQLGLSGGDDALLDGDALTLDFRRTFKRWARFLSKLHTSCVCVA